MQETWITSLGQEDPLEKRMATYSSILAQRILWTEGPGGLQSMGLQRIRHTTEPINTQNYKEEQKDNEDKDPGSCYLGEGNGKRLQDSRLENPRDRGTWQEPGRLQSMRPLRVRTWLSNFTFTFHFHSLEKEMATHSSVLAWRIPGMGEPGGLPSTGSHRVKHDWSDLAAAAAAAVVISEEREEEKEGKESRKSALKASKNIGIFFFSKRVVGNGSLLSYYY